MNSIRIVHSLHQSSPGSEQEWIWPAGVRSHEFLGSGFSLSQPFCGYRVKTPGAIGWPGNEDPAIEFVTMLHSFFCTKTVVSGSWPIQVLGSTPTRYVLVLWQGPLREAPLSADASHWLVYSFCYAKKETTEQLYMLLGGASKTLYSVF